VAWASGGRSRLCRNEASPAGFDDDFSSQGLAVNHSYKESFLFSSACFECVCFCDQGKQNRAKPFVLLGGEGQSQTE
jgi:hypothetical protein